MSTIAWKVMPCPVHGGKHPYHDQRWIVTADAEIEVSPGGEQWCVTKGSLICELRDVLPGTGTLIAAAPKLLEALRRLVVIIDRHNPSLSLGGGDLLELRHTTAMDEARAAIAKAEVRP